MIVDMNINTDANNLMREDIPILLETIGFKDDACSMRQIRACEYARAAEFLKGILERAKGVMIGSTYDDVAEFGFWAMAALWSAVDENESDFIYCFNKYKIAVHEWWSSFVIH